MSGEEVEADAQAKDHETAHVDDAHRLRGVILDICLTVCALVVCLVAFATSSRVTDRTAGLPIPLDFIDQSVTADLTVRIDDRNRILVQQEPLDKYATLSDYLNENNLAPQSVHIVASEGCLIESVLNAIRSLRRIGITNVYLSTSSI